MGQSVVVIEQETKEFSQGRRRNIFPAKPPPQKVTPQNISPLETHPQAHTCNSCKAAFKRVDRQVEYVKGEARQEESFIRQESDIKYEPPIYQHNNARPTYHNSWSLPIARVFIEWKYDEDETAVSRVSANPLMSQTKLIEKAKQVERPKLNERPQMNTSQVAINQFFSGKKPPEMDFSTSETRGRVQNLGFY